MKNLMLKIPNYLTITRIVLIPVIVVIFYIPKAYVYNLSNEIAVTLFIIACITDWLDGFLARRWNAFSQFGAFLDPIADKLIVAVSLILLTKLGRIELVPVVIIISREIIISGLREWMAILGKNAAVSVSNLGKYKTTFQMLAIGFLLSSEYPIYDTFTTYFIGQVFLWIAVLLTVVSMISYFNSAFIAQEKLS